MTLGIVASAWVVAGRVDDKTRVSGVTRDLSCELPRQVEWAILRIGAWGQRGAWHCVLSVGGRHEGGRQN
jgi:hypothetical protein